MACDTTNQLEKYAEFKNVQIQYGFHTKTKFNVCNISKIVKV